MPVLLVEGVKTLRWLEIQLEEEELAPDPLQNLQGSMQNENGGGRSVLKSY